MSFLDNFGSYLMAHNPFASASQTPPATSPAPAPMSATSHMQATNDAMARRLGFRDAATAAGYYQHQQDMRTGPAGPSSASSGGSLLDAALALHPAMLLNRVTNAFTQAGQ